MTHTRVRDRQNGVGFSVSVCGSGHGSLRKAAGPVGQLWHALVADPRPRGQREGFWGTYEVSDPIVDPVALWAQEAGLHPARRLDDERGDFVADFRIQTSTTRISGMTMAFSAQHPSPTGMTNDQNDGCHQSEITPERITDPRL